MFSTPKKRRIPTKGLFLDGIWHCNCNPRVPAIHFQVKKPGANQGRWFYTCQEPKDTGCGFFLWKEEAVPREMGVVMNNSRSEEEQDKWRTPVTAEKDRNTIEGQKAASNKFMEGLGKKDELTDGDEGEDGDGDFGMESEDEEALLKVVETSEAAVSPETPGGKRKRAENTLLTPTTGSSSSRSIFRSGGVKDDEIFGTPSSPSPRYSKSGHGTSTFVTPWKDDDVFATPTSKSTMGPRNKNDIFGLHGTSKTPTPSRMLPPPFPTANASTLNLNTDMSTTYDMSDEVLDILKDEHLDEVITTKLKGVMNRYAMKTSGIARGRDITRVALKSKETRITELQERVRALEQEREMDKSIIRYLKADNNTSAENRRLAGRGRGGGGDGEPGKTHANMA